MMVKFDHVPREYSKISNPYRDEHNPETDLHITRVFASGALLRAKTAHNPWRSHGQRQRGFRADAPYPFTPPHPALSRQVRGF